MKAGSSALPRAVVIVMGLVTSVVAKSGSVGSFIGGGPPGFNVLNNTCTRLRHQSTWKNEALWIDGGLQTYTNFTNNDTDADQPTGSTTLAQNTYMISVNGSYLWDWHQNVSEVAYQKLNVTTANGAQPPVTMKGALYSGKAADERIWLFGGTTSWQNMSAPNFTWPTPDRYSLWSFDTIQHSWAPFDVTPAVPTRPYNGFVAEAPDLSLGFWINGAIDSGSSTAAQAYGSYHELFQPGMVVFDFSNPNSPTATNVTGPPWGDTRVGGMAQYVPGIGPEGIIVAFGGGGSPAQQATGQDQGNYAGMSDIWVFDVSKRNSSSQESNNGWYLQRATGDVPPTREDSCTVGFASPDNSSYQIYIYGGRHDSAVYDDMYALSLPSFTWTQTYGGAKPRWGHTCERVNRGQMMIAGGAGSASDLSMCDSNVRGVDIYDFGTHSWGSVYHPGNQSSPYQVEPQVSHAIGGNVTGFATKLSPDGDWDSVGVAQLFGQHRSHHSGLSRGAVAGIVIGVLAFISIAAALIVFLVFLPRRRRLQRLASEKDRGSVGSSDAGASDGGATALQEMDTTPLAEMDAKTTIAEKSDATQVPVEVPADSVVHEMDADEGQPHDSKKDAS